MAITATARRRAVWVRTKAQSERLQGRRDTVYTLRHFAEIETGDGQRALLRAAKALELLIERG